MSSDEKGFPLSRLESLPTIVVDMIGRQLGSKDRKSLRASSLAMHNHMDFALRDTFKVIRCCLEPSASGALDVFKQQPLARAVETLIWEKPMNVILGKKSSHSLGSPSRVRSMISNSVNGFANLRAIGLACETEHELVSYSAADMELWMEAICQITKPLEVRIYDDRTGYWGIYWTGKQQPSHDAFVRTSTPFAALPSAYSPWKSSWKGAQWNCLLNPIKPLPGLLATQLKSLHLYRTIFHTRYILDCKAEEVSVEECLLIGKKNNRSADARGNMTVRALSFSSCSLTPQKREYLQDLFINLRDHSDLQSLRFERVGDLAFDWDGEGSRDCGEKVPLMVEEFGVKETLTKMSDCLCVPSGQGHEAS